MDEPTAGDLRMRTGDFLKAFAFAMVIVVVTAVTVAAFVEPPQERPVARVTTDDLQAMADIARAIVRNPRSTPAQVRTARHLEDVVDAVENGEVEIIPPTTAPPPATAAPTTSTTTTTTTAAPPPEWPGVFDAPPVTLLTIPTVP